MIASLFSVALFWLVASWGSGSSDHRGLVGHFNFGPVGEPRAVVVLVHGVWSDRSVFDQFEKKVAATHLPGAWLIKFDWGEDLPFQASEAVGDRAHSVTGMSDQAFVAVAKLKEVVARAREAVGSQTPIHLVTHSQGSVIALCCLQEGMVVDNWILMGSPLGKTIVSSGSNFTSLGTAARNVRGLVINLSSLEDDVVWIKNGIGKFGLPKTIHGLAGQTDGGRPANVLNVEIPGVDHFGDNSWWTCEWLAGGDTRAWKGALDRSGLLQILGQGGPAVPVTDPFKEIQQFAAEGTRNASWRRIFGDADLDEFEFIFTLTPGMMNGIYFDDKDVAEYEVECLTGACRWQIMSATNSSWDKVQPEQPIQSGQTARGAFEVKFRSTLIKQDATIFLKATGTGDSISKVRLRLVARDL